MIDQIFSMSVDSTGIVSSSLVHQTIAVESFLFELKKKRKEELIRNFSGQSQLKIERLCKSLGSLDDSRI